MPATATHDVKVTARFPEHLLELVDQVAAEEDRPRSQVIRRAVERDMAARAPRINDRRSA